MPVEKKEKERDTAQANTCSSGLSLTSKITLSTNTNECFYLLREVFDTINSFFLAGERNDSQYACFVKIFSSFHLSDELLNHWFSVDDQNCVILSLEKIYLVLLYALNTSLEKWPNKYLNVLEFLVRWLLNMEEKDMARDAFSTPCYAIENFKRLNGLLLSNVLTIICIINTNSMVEKQKNDIFQKLGLSGNDINLKSRVSAFYNFEFLALLIKSRNCVKSAYLYTSVKNNLYLLIQDSNQLEFLLQSKSLNDYQKEEIWDVVKNKLKIIINNTLARSKLDPKYLICHVESLLSVAFLNHQDRLLIISALEDIFQALLKSFEAFQSLFMLDCLTKDHRTEILKKMKGGIGFVNTIHELKLVFQLRCLNNNHRTQILYAIQENILTIISNFDRLLAVSSASFLTLSQKELMLELLLTSCLKKLMNGEHLSNPHKHICLDYKEWLCNSFLKKAKFEDLTNAMTSGHSLNMFFSTHRDFNFFFKETNSIVSIRAKHTEMQSLLSPPGDAEAIELSVIHPSSKIT